MAGAGYKLFTTGQVLTAAEVNTYLQEQTVMVFNDAASRTTALSGVLAEGMVSYLKSTKVVEIYNGTAWASLDDPNAIQNTIVDAKGDLISASGNDVPARLAVGNNGETLVADSSTSTGLRWQEPKSVNGLLNSNFNIWQRGTSGFSAYLVYTADRWQKGGQTHYTVSRATVSDATNLPNIQYAARIQRNSGSTSTATIDLAQTLETADSIKYAGKTVTLSFYARKGANYSGAAGASFGFALYTGTGTDQSVMAGFTGSAATLNTGAALTTSMARYSATVTIPTTTTEIGIYFSYTPSGTAGANDYVDITGVQLEVGSVATPYQPYSATLPGELGACQRYFYRAETNGYNYFAPSSARSSTVTDVSLPLPVTMRTAPALTFSAANTFMIYDSATIVTATAISADAPSPFCAAITVTVASGLAARAAGTLRANNTTATINCSAEL